MNRLKLSQSDIEAARRKRPLSAVIGRSVKLLHAGGPEWTALCPFHK